MKKVIYIKQLFIYYSLVFRFWCLLLEMGQEKPYFNLPRVMSCDLKSVFVCDWGRYEHLFYCQVRREKDT